MQSLAGSDADDHTVGTHSDRPTEITLCQKLSTWAVKNKCQRRTVNELLEILRAEGHNLPIDGRTLLATPQEIPILTKCSGDYIYFGIEEGIRKVLSKNLSFIEKNKTIDLKVNIDGLPLFKSTNAQFWPILGRFGNLFVIALFYGNTKPTPVEEYQDDFLEWFDKLKHDGLTFKSHKL